MTRAKTHYNIIGENSPPIAFSFLRLAEESFDQIAGYSQ